MSAVGILGGTFDPIHLGHLITAQSLLEIRKLEKIIFIPSYISPHKTDQEITGEKHRLKMLELATEENKFFEISDIELSEGSVSYTVDTLEKLSKKFKKIELIIGLDNLLDFHNWKNPDRIIELAKLVVLKKRIDDNKVNKNKYYRAAEFIDTPLIEISSSEIRERVKNKLPINYLVPEKVKEHILRNKLYKE